MLTPLEKSPLPETFSSEEDRTHDAASSRTVSPTQYQRAIPASRHRYDDRTPESPAHEADALPLSHRWSNGSVRSRDQTTSHTARVVTAVSLNSSRYISTYVLFLRQMSTMHTCFTSFHLYCSAQLSTSNVGKS